MLALARLPQAEHDREPQTALGQRLAVVLASPGAWRTGARGPTGLHWPSVTGLVADLAVPAGQVLTLAARAESALLAALDLDRRQQGARQSEAARWAATRAADPALAEPAFYEWIDDAGAAIAPPPEVLH